MEARREQRMFLVLLLLFLSQTEQATESSSQQDLECIVTDEECMVCDWGSEQKPAGNYSLHYRGRPEAKHYAYSQMSYWETQFSECMFWKLGSTEFLLVYQPPHCTKDSLPNLLQIVVDVLLETPSLVVLGDFNIHSDTVKTTQDFTESMASMGLSLNYHSRDLHLYGLWYESEEEKQCESYLQSDGINTGCSFNKVRMFKNFYVYVSTSNGTKVFQKKMQLQNQGKPSPPIDFRFKEESNNQLLLSWGTAKLPSRCLEHIVKYKSNKDKTWQEVKTNEMRYIVPSVDPEKFYTFFVHSKVKSVCATTKLWSKPAGPLFWGKNMSSEDAPTVSFWIQKIIIPVGCVFILLLLLLILMRMERVWLVLMPRIPNPRNKFEDLFTAHQGNFSEWVGVSKDAVESFKPNYCESICYVSELFPGGGYLPICNNATGKTGGVAGIPAGPTLKINIE